jgi:hypothetical protein
MQHYFNANPEILVMLLAAGLFVLGSAWNYLNILIFRAMWRIGPIALGACALIALGLLLH